MIDQFERHETAPLDAAQEFYDPGFLLDSLLDKMRMKTDAELAKALKIDKRLIFQIRDHRLQISGFMLLLMQEATGISVGELRLMLRDRRRKSRMAGVPVSAVVKVSRVTEQS